MEDYEKEETLKIIGQLVDELEETDKEIIKLYFGFYDDKRYTQCEIAEIIHFTQSNVARRNKKILTQLSIKLEKQKIIEKNSSVYLSKRKKK